MSTQITCAAGRELNTLCFWEQNGAWSKGGPSTAVVRCGTWSCLPLKLEDLANSKVAFPSSFNYKCYYDNWLLNACKEREGCCPKKTLSTGKHSSQLVLVRQAQPLGSDSGMKIPCSDPSLTSLVPFIFFLPYFLKVQLCLFPFWLWKIDFLTFNLVITLYLHLSFQP